MISFALTHRSLIFFRAGLGALLLWDLFDRARSIRYHYTDQGIYPGPALWSWDEFLYSWSVHHLSGSLLWQLILFITTALAVGAFVKGWRPLFSGLIAWFLLLSLQNRNPFICFGVDDVLRLSLFWSAFLPWAEIEKDEAGVTDSPITAILMSQVLVIFFFAGVQKLFDEDWQSGRALSLATAAHPNLLTPIVLALPKLSTLLNFIAIGLQISAPLAAINLLRRPMVVIFISLQIIMAFTIDLAHFPMACAVAWMALWPGKTIAAGSPKRSMVYSFLIFTIPLICIFSNIFPRSITQALEIAGLDQRWRYFTPPPRVRRTVQVDAQLKNGQWVDLTNSSWVREGSRIRWSQFSFESEKRPDLAFQLIRMICREGQGTLRKVKIISIYKDLLQQGVPYQIPNAEQFCDE